MYSTEKKMKTRLFKEKVMKQHSIFEQLKQQIVSGHFKPGERLPPRTEFEQTYKATPNTIQRAFHRLAAEGFVESQSRQGTFVAAAPPHLSNYALLIYSKRIPGDWQNNFWATLDRVGRELSRNTSKNISVRPCIAPEFHSQEYEDLLADIRAHRLAGLIYCFPPDLAVGTPLIDNPGLPSVSLMDHRQANIPSIALNGRQFLTRAFEYFVDRGRRRIAVIFPPNSYDRLPRSLMDIAGEHGITLDETWLQSVDLLNPQWADNLVRLLMRGSAADRPDGLLVGDDNLLDFACRGLIKSGVRVPDDLEVVGHANFPLAGADLLPVCRLGFDVHQMLVAAIEQIDRQRRGEPVPARIWIPARFAAERQGGFELPPVGDPHVLPTTNWHYSPELEMIRRGADMMARN